MKKFITILTVLVPAISFAVFQNTASFKEGNDPLSLTNDAVVELDGSINIANAVEKFTDFSSKAESPYYGNVSTSGVWITHEQLTNDDSKKILDESVEKSLIDFDTDANSKIVYSAPESKKDLEFIFKSDSTYFDSNIGLDGEPLPGTAISVAIGAIVLGALRKRKN